MTTPTTTASTTTTASCHPSCRSSSATSAKSSWLQAALAEVEQKFQSVAGCGGSYQLEEEEPDSFAERAENYYRKRPQLLSLLHDLYNRYVSLADRYAQALKPHQQQQQQQLLLHRRSQSQVSTVPSDLDDASDLPDFSSDAESSLSFQPQHPADAAAADGAAGGGSTAVADSVVAELVAKTVENEILMHEIGVLDKYQSESTRKVELQRSLLEVLESERMVLLSENARLGFRAAAAEGENGGLAAEVGYMRKKAGELARCVVKLREEHRVCALGRKIEGLQAQIYGLEKRNRECYEVMARREEEKAELVRGVCLELERLKAENKRLREEAARLRGGVGVGGKGKAGKRRWWGRMRGLDCLLCGAHVATERL